MLVVVLVGSFASAVLDGLDECEAQAACGGRRRLLFDRCDAAERVVPVFCGGARVVGRRGICTRRHGCQGQGQYRRGRGVGAAESRSRDGVAAAGLRTGPPARSGAGVHRRRWQLRSWKRWIRCRRIRTRTRTSMCKWRWWSGRFRSEGRRAMRCMPGAAQSWKRPVELQGLTPKCAVFPVVTDPGRGSRWTASGRVAYSCGVPACRADVRGSPASCGGCTHGDRGGSP